MIRANRRPIRCAAALALTCGSFAPGAGSAQPPAFDPMIRAAAIQQVTDHVYVIPDRNVAFVPNVGIVVGERATLIVDTGLGTANGQIVLEAARQLADHETFYITATHFHPEHDLGAEAFPADTKVVRWIDQQREADDQGPATIERFAGFSPVLAELLDGVQYRQPDVLFDESVTIDLGGVQVVARGVGPNHTRGDTVFWVEGDRVLFTGDVVMSVFPAVNGQAGDIDKWLRNLETFNRLDPAVIVPAHGRIGDIGLVRRYRGYLETVREQVVARQRAGDSLDQITEALAGDLAAEFADLAPPNGNPTGRINAAIQAAYGLRR